MDERYEELYSCTVFDADGARIGGVHQVYLDDATAEPTFVAARTGLFGNKEVLVPLLGAVIADDQIQVPHSVDLVKQAPAPLPDRHLDPEHEAAVYRHYGLGFTLPDAALHPSPVTDMKPAGEETDQSA